MDFGEAIMTHMFLVTRVEQDTCHEHFERTLTSSQAVFSRASGTPFQAQIFRPGALMWSADNAAAAA
jgi:hypothetical protein